MNASDEDIFTLFESDLVQLRLTGMILASLIVKGVISKKGAIAMLEDTQDKLTKDHPLEEAIKNLLESLEKVG